MTVTNAIEVKNVSKVYKLYDKPVDRLKEVLFSCFGRRYHREFFALKDINFQVKKGETVGIIGKNGAGKSTLLKIITGVLTPTGGEVTVNGRISSLLELGAGFNPELTGMENIYFNSSLLGLTKEETDAKIDEILEFADIGEFIDQPVKTYSSGMYVRLAFSVAINVEPDILIIDEALAVGDARFQRKCFAKFEMLKKNGMTLIFVSHDMGSIKQICDKAFLINGGEIVSGGIPKEVIVIYHSYLFPQNEVSTEAEGIKERSNSKGFDDYKIDLHVNENNNFGMGGAFIQAVILKNTSIPVFKGGDEVKIEVIYDYNLVDVNNIASIEGVESNFILGASLSDVKGTFLFGMTTIDKEIFLSVEDSKIHQSVTFEFYMPILPKGDYLLNCAIALGVQENHVQLNWYDSIVAIHVEQSRKNIYGVFYHEYKVEV